MQTVRLGTSGPEVSRIGLGCMAMSGTYGPADRTEAIATIHAATEGTHSSDLTFTVPRASLAQARSAIAERKDAIGYGELLADDAVAKVSIVGVGIRSNPQLAATMFETLAERGINLLAITGSEIKVSALVAEADLELAVRVLHTAFGLDAEKAA